jgi:hypothetical protein
MPRRKEAPRQATEYTVRELLLKHDIDPLEEMMKMYQHELPWPVDGDGNVLVDELKALLPYWEPAVNEKGKKILRLKTDKRIELLKELAQYAHPKLRGAEVRGNVDYNITVNIKSFEPTKVITSEPVRQAIADAVVVEENGEDA